MKKTVWFLMVLLFLTTACSNTGTADEENDADQPVEQELSNEQEEEKNNDFEKDKNNKQEKEMNQAKQTSDEVPKPTYKIDEDTSSVIPLQKNVDEKVVLLTIDDAPDRYALKMAKTLKEMNAGAIFFVNGHFLNTDKEKKVLRKIHSMGFAIGNHTYSHAFLPDLSKAEQKEEIIRLNNLIEKIIGEKPKFFRAPHGENTNYSRKVAADEGMIVMNWTYGYDYFKPYMDAEKLTKAMVTGKGPAVDVPYSLLKPGANLLMHDRKWTAKALPAIVKGLRDKGYEMVEPEQIKTIQ
ncbi:polysaccharide deacetylase family protein [Virgibacillus ihumii]|uniref:polysaccharide deacetylase family protein n=1 Tax=Virgibacillus ihumii TaxID=2686091 RepID=UPI00157D8EE2|nr:polysaccharide deacetylase family protein [Virgibacillus ihumii]